MLIIIIVIIIIHEALICKNRIPANMYGFGGGFELVVTQNTE
jgi:hypothetical protein